MGGKRGPLIKTEITEVEAKLTPYHASGSLSMEAKFAKSYPGEPWPNRRIRLPSYMTEDGFRLDMRIQQNKDKMDVQWYANDCKALCDIMGYKLLKGGKLLQRRREIKKLGRTLRS